MKKKNNVVVKKEKRPLMFKLFDKLHLNQYMISQVDNWINENPYSLLSYYKPTRKEVLKLEEYRRWFGGDSQEIELFFKRNIPYLINNHRFYRDVNGEMPRVHFPLPSAISQAMSTLVFNTMPKINAFSYNEEDEFEYEKIIYDILKENDYIKLFQKGSQWESYSGGLAAKLSIIDSEILIDFYAQGEFELVGKNGRIEEIIFRDYLNKDKKNYNIISYYGYGYIKYKLFEITKDGEKELSLDSLEETEDLKDVYLVDSSGKPIKILMAVFKVNRSGNNQFINSLYGSSDYEGLTDIFDSLDETISTLQDYYRSGRIFLNISESLLVKDERGNFLNNPWGMKNIMKLSTTPETQKENVSRDIPQLNNVQYMLDGIRSYINLACQRVGLAPASLGIDSAGANQSGEALTIREYTSERTRNDKIKLWSEFIEKLSKLILIYSFINESEGVLSDEKIIYLFNDELDKINVTVSFSPYNEEKIDDKFNRLFPLYERGFMLKDDLIKIIYSDEKSIEEINDLIDELNKIEKNKNEKIIPSPANFEGLDSNFVKNENHDDVIKNKSNEK